MPRFPLLRLVSLFASLATFSIAFAPPARVQQAQTPLSSAQGATKTMRSFHHVPLTEEKAKAALEVFLTLKKKYPPQTFANAAPGPMGVVAAMKASKAAAEILKLVREKGFESMDDWARTFTSLGMAVVHVRQGSDEDVQAKLRDLEQAPMPEEMKARIRAMLRAMIPPQRNVKVAQKLLANPQWAKKIEEVEKDR